MTKFFKGKSKKAAQVPQVPRSMEEIQKEYGELRARSGELQYTIYVYEADLAQMNSRLRGLNNEAAARQQLDKATETKPEVKDVTNEQPATN
jgi:hypothetical protein